MIDHYDWPGGREAMLRFGPTNGPVVIAAMPLFEEANRTRAFIVTILRALAERGIASALPDLPGTGESLVETENASINDWQKAFISASESLKANHGAVHGLAFRGGTLLDSAARLESRWHFAPVAGDSLVRDMLRTRLAIGDAGDAMDPAGSPIELAGNRVSQALLADLAEATPSSNAPLRTVRLDTDPLAADRQVIGPPLWRRSEPGNDPVLARLLADDIAAWIASCAA